MGGVEDLGHLTKFVSQLNEKISGALVMLDKFAKDNEQLKTHLPKIDSLERSKAESISSSLDFKKELADIRTEQKSLKAQIQTNARANDSLNLFLKDLGEIAASKSELEAVRKDIVDMKSSPAISNINSALAQLKAELTTQIESVRNLRTVATIDPVMAQKVEIGSLDSSNAMLKTNNLEMQLRLLERKYENLSIQVKKLELTR